MDSSNGRIETYSSANDSGDTCCVAKEPVKRSSIDEALKCRFKEKMKRSNVPLLKDYKPYCEHLPRRHINGFPALPLYEQEYLVRSEDLDRMSKTIEQPVLGDVRRVVHYLSAPPGSGKTASVLSAFLQSHDATHYLYLSFDNNNKKNFKVTPFEIGTTDSVMAEKQGATFMVQCVKNLLEGRGSGNVPSPAKIDQSNSASQSCTDDLEAYLKNMLGEDCHIWFHVDEHKKMITREYPNDIPRQLAAAAFFRGAMTVLASLNCSRVIATYVEPPGELATTKSSSCFRNPITLPSLDIDKVISHVPELMKLNEKKVEGNDNKRLWVTLRFRLGIKIRELGIAEVLHLKGATQAKQFLSTFEKIVQANKKDKLSSATLIELNKLCKTPILEELSEVLTNNVDAAKLLVGVAEGKIDSEWIYNKRLETGLVVCEPSGLISCSLTELVAMNDPTIKVYNDGRNLFMNGQRYNQGDLLSTPLEYSYFWSLACKSAVEGSLKLGDHSYRIKCNMLESARIFTGINTELDISLVSKLKKNIIYYAQERKPDTHPMADLFFVTENDELVLVDITGSGDKDKIMKKLHQKAKFLKQNAQRKLCSSDGKIEKTRCVVLAPGFRRTLAVEGVDLVCGTRAIVLLGGLGQFFHWMVVVGDGKT